MSRNPESTFASLVTGRGPSGFLYVIGVKEQDGLPYACHQDANGAWHDGGRLLPDTHMPWSALAAAQGSDGSLRVVGLGRGDELPYLVWQDAQGGWHDGGRLLPEAHTPWSALAAGQGSDGTLQVIGLGRADSLPYLAWQDAQGAWHDGGRLLKGTRKPWSTLVMGPGRDGALQLIGVGRDDGLPYRAWQDAQGTWHDSGRLLKTSHRPWSALATGQGSDNSLQVICLGRSDGLPYRAWQDSQGSWQDAGRLLPTDDRPWSALAAAQGSDGSLHVIGLGREDGLPTLAWQDAQGGWQGAEAALLHLLPLAFDYISAGTGSTGFVQVIGLGRDDGLPYLLYQDQGGWHAYGLLPLGEAKIERTLNPGEVLLFSKENFQGRQWLIDADAPSLAHIFPAASVRLGPRTGVTVYTEVGFQGLAQELAAELGSFSGCRLQGQGAKSIQLWSTTGKGFGGGWVIEAAPGRYLSVGTEPQAAGLLCTSPSVLEYQAFRITDLGYIGSGRRKVSLALCGMPQAQTTASAQTAALTLEALAGLTQVDEPQAGFRKFSLLTEAGEWLAYDPAADRFFTSRDPAQRTIFCQSIKLAEDETQVGELLPGEAALFENPGYWGKAWILYTDYADFGCIAGLNDAISSIMLGPYTGATLYRQAQFRADDPQAGKQDITTHVSSLAVEQVGENQISSIDLWRIVEPAGLGIAIKCILSQDFRGSSYQFDPQRGDWDKTGSGFEEYTSYRTTLRLPSSVESVEVWTTDATQIEVDDQFYAVDEDHPVTLHPNPFQCLVVTTDAFMPVDGQPPRGSLTAPGLKIRTNTMLPHERIMIYPDQEVHGRLAKLSADDLWNAELKDRNGGSKPLIAERSEEKKVDVANAHHMINNAMSTISYSKSASGSWSQGVNPPESLQNKGWKLNFHTYRVTADTLYVRQGPGKQYPPVKAGYLRRDEVVEVLEFNQAATWMHIRRVDGKLEGWSSCLYFDQISDTPLPAVGERFRVTVANLHVRAGPEVKAASLRVIRAGDIVTALGVNLAGTWRQIRCSDGLEGWSYARYLERVPATPPRALGLAGPALEAAEVSYAAQEAPPPPVASLSPQVRFEEISLEEVQSLVAMAESPDERLGQAWFFDDIVQAVKSAVAVVLAQVEQTVSIIVRLADKVVKWVADTAQKVVAFVEGIFEKIGVGINDFVNFMRYVFDWNDIRETRDTLKEYINDGLEYLKNEFVQQASQQVGSFFAQSRDAIDRVLAQAIRALGGDPNRPATSSNFVTQIIEGYQSSGIPDTLEWVVSKINSLGMGSGDPAFAAAGAQAQPASLVDIKLGAFWTNTLVKGLEGIGELGGGVIEVATMLVKNPGQPLLAVAALLNMLRGMLVGLIDAGETIVQGLLELVSDLLDRAKEILNADIRIPFISDFCEWMGGQPVTLDFSLLDAATLILAIPITIIFKALFHAAPFKEARALQQQVPVITPGFAVFSASYFCSAASSLISTPLDCGANLKLSPRSTQTAEALGLDVRLIVEWMSWTFSLGSFILGLVAGPLLESEKPQPENPAPPPAPETGVPCVVGAFLPVYDFILLGVDCVCLEYASGSTARRARLRRLDTTRAGIATGLGLAHLLMYVVRDWSGINGNTIADSLMVLPDVAGFLGMFTPPWVDAIFTVDMLAMGAAFYPPIQKYFELHPLT